MSEITREFCVACGDDREIRREKQTVEYDVRGEKIGLELPVRVCQTCGTIEAEGVDPAEMAFAEYRRRKGLLTPEQIHGIRKQYKLSQRSLAALLGMSEATINRYEGGGLQDEAHDQAIRSCQNPDTMRNILQRRGDRLSDWRRQRIEEVLEGETMKRPDFAFDTSMSRTMPNELSPTTGYRRFDYKRYAAVVVWFCRRLPLVTATSLNKLLFYADFLHYQSETISLTGAKYRRLPYGPAPADYGNLRQHMEIDELVEIREVLCQNGHPAEEFRPGPRADELGVSFTPRERKTLETVALAFEKVTPSEISDRSHQEPPWQYTPDGMLISYEKAMELSLSLPPHHAPSKEMRH